MATNNVDYEDSSPVPASVTPTEDNVDQLAKLVAEWVRTKMYGVDVREALARWVEINLAVMKLYDGDIQSFQTTVRQLMADVTARQTGVEKRQTSVESDFNKVIANATQDSEVILARSSTIYGNFGVLDQRLENIEQMLAMAIPAGYTVTINHGLNRNPTVVVHYYEYALGTEPAGLGTGPAGTFGGTPAKTLESTVSYPDANTVKIDLPAGFALSGTPVYQSNDGYWYIIDGYRVLRFDLGVKLGVDDPDTSGGSTEGGSTSNPSDGDGSDDAVPATPTNVTFTQLTDTTGRVDWQTGN